MDGTSHITLRISEKITVQKGKQRVGDISHCEQGEKVIVSYAVSAIGLSVLLVYFYRKRMKNSLPSRAPLDNASYCQDERWKDSEEF
jgi:hypothetical protein